MRSSEGWLPNLARGVSVWNLADDLNDEALFDGRLLTPETEGPDNLPEAVVWDVESLVPLAQARREHPAAVRRAIMDFHICIERSAPFFEPGNAFDDYRDAFTLPTLQTDEGRHYFFDPQTGKLHVMHWGATRRHGGPASTLVLRKLSFQVFTGERPPPPPSEPQSAADEASEARPRHARRRGLLVAIAMAAALLAAGLWWARRDEPREEPPPSTATSARAAASTAASTAASPPPAPPPPSPSSPPGGTANAGGPPPDFVPERIYFAVGSAVLTPEARSAVARLAAHLNATAEPALVEGHTDPTGAENENATLSARRSLAVLAALRREGVASTLDGVGCAARYPASAAAGREPPTTRRRVEIYLGEAITRPGCFAVSATR